MANNFATVNPNFDSGLKSIPPISGDFYKSISKGGPPSPSGGPGYLKYPSDMSDSQDRIKFTAQQLPKPSLSKSPGKINISEPKPNDYIIVPGTQPIFLPIQPSISDQNTANWGGGELNELQRQFANLALGAMNGGFDKVNEAISKGLSTIFSKKSSTFNTFVNAGQLVLAEQAVGVQGLLSRATGSVLNPNLELLFQGPTLRPFQFQFKLSPRNEDEAVNVKKIIKFFKKNMAVQRGDSSLFLKAPYVFGIEYQHGTKEHQSMNKIKTCALQSCSVDYTPLGSYMTFNDEEATMVSYNMSLQFQEIIPVYSDDYDDHSIGY